MLRITISDLACSLRLLALSLLIGCLSAGLTTTAQAQSDPSCAPELARVTSVQGEVEIRSGAVGPWRAARLGDVLCVDTTVRVGGFSRAALAFVDDSTLRLDQNTLLTLRPREGERRTWLEMLTGAIHFFSHRPRSLGIETPYVNAAAEGTEFLIRIGADRAHILMYEGIVLAENESGKIRLAPGDAALIRAGEKPVPEIVIRPRDAVAWAVHYPPVLSELADGGAPGAYAMQVRNALDWVQRGNYRYALRSLDQVPETERDARHESLRAGIFLNIGRVEEAEAAIARALARDENSADALALRTILHVVRNDRAQALRDADRAVQLAPTSSPALIAQSYARQANFDLEGARASLREASQKNPSDALAYARLAEIELSFGDVDRANQAAALAKNLAPDLARTQTVSGFSELAAINTDAAQKAFTRAIELYSADPLPHLGLGLAKIRDGFLEEGRKDLEIAASLDPNNALIRSYLGKAYFEEKRGPKDATQFEIAKTLDPNDPTPYLYDAIRKQSENRPVEALRDLEKTIELNENRAVYRSRLLLDGDLASRSAGVARIYDDLGFEQLALLEGWKSIHRDPKNHSAHVLLADTYSNIPRNEIASASELLVGQLLQPSNLRPVQPRLSVDGLTFPIDSDLGPVGFNEFSQLFEANRLGRVHADFVAGTQNTFGDNVVVNGLIDKVSYSFGHFHYKNIGFRENNDLNQDLYNAFLQYQFNPDTSFLFDVRKQDLDTGDLNLFFDPDNFRNRNRNNADIQSTRLGFRHRITPRSTAIGSVLHNEIKINSELPDFLGGSTLSGEEIFNAIELRNIYSGFAFNNSSGLEYIDGEIDQSFTNIALPSIQDSSDIRYGSIYTYSDVELDDNLTLLLGIGFSTFEGLERDRDQINPKFGISWYATESTLLRAAAFRTFPRPVGVRQTLEPTNVAGFNQLFIDPVGTDAWRYGIAIDQRIGGHSAFGIEASKRLLDVPTSTDTVIDQNEINTRLYFYQILSDELSLNLEYRYEEYNNSINNPSAFVDLRMHRVPIELRVFRRDGTFAGIKVSYIYQDGEFIDIFTGETEKGKDNFFITDLNFGYRFSNRFGLASIEIRNIFNEKFRFQDIDPTNAEVSFDRSILARLSIVF